MVEMEDRKRMSKLHTVGNSGVWKWGRKNNWIELVLKTVVQESFLEIFENLNIHFE